MARIFSSLALFAVLLLLGNIVLGFYLGDLGHSSGEYEKARRSAHDLELTASAANSQVVQARAEKDRQLAKLADMRRRLQPHIWLGIAGALVAVLVNCISVTYFIGTSRWCREVVDAYGLDESLAQRSRALKRRAFPFALLGMMAILAIVSLGAASDPGSSLAQPSSWVIPHLMAALLGTAVIAIAFYFQVTAVEANFAIIREILAEAERVRIAPREIAPAYSDTAHASGGR